MNLKDMKRKVYALIEELNPQSEVLTDDPDLQAKFNEVTNQVMFELARMKKIPKFVKLPVTKGDTIEFADIEKVCGYEVYQLGNVTGAAVEYRANGTILNVLESGTAEIDCFVYPERIGENTKDKAYEFELSPDVLEIMPYGIAADLLKADVSVDYGRIYADRYEAMKMQLDPRYAMPSITIEGGYLV